MDEKYDMNTGKTKEETKDEDIMASTYDNDGNYYVVKRDRKVYKKDGDNYSEVTDQKKIIEILNHFIAETRDVIYDDDHDREN